MTAWHSGKVFVEDSVNVSHDALHVIFGMLVWLLFALILRRSAMSRWPWLWALAVILWNETVDLWTEQWPDRETQYVQGVKDVLLTMLVPTVVMAAARLRPQLFQRARRTRRRS